MASMSRVVLLAACLVGSSMSAVLRASVKPHANGTSLADEQAEVAKLHAKLEQMATGVTTLLGGPLSHTAIGPEMQTFLAELKNTLNETSGEKNVTLALKKLKDAQAGVQSLTKDMTLQQTRLMKEGDDQEVNLLMGVLMTKKTEPMDKQLEVLESSEFAKLPVVKAVLAAKDVKTPLFQQVAGWMDQHTEKVVPTAEMIPNKLKKGKDGKPDVAPIVNALSARLHSLEDSEQHTAQLHEEEMKHFEDAVKKEEKKNATKVAHRIGRMEKKERRDFEKQAAMSKHDIQSLKTAISAVEKGDMKALMTAKTALSSSLKAMEAKSGGFLYLIQLGHRATNRDCPFCAAQCFDKCHAAGKSYVQCLTDCQDAGK